MPKQSGTGAAGPRQAGGRDHEEPTTLDTPAAFTVRPSLPSDAPAIAHLLQPFVDSRKLLQRSLQEITDLTRHGFLAELNEDQALVGFCSVEIYNRKLGEIQCLAVREGFQNRGIGRALVQHCLERARELGVMEVMAISSSDEFLRTCGFDYSLPDQKRALFCQLRARE